MSNVQQFIDLVGQGENAQAQETLSDILSAKAFQALEEYKQAVGENLFATEEVVEEDAEQLDEISLNKASDAYAARVDRMGKAKDDASFNKHDDKAMKTSTHIRNRYGATGVIKAGQKAGDYQYDSEKRQVYKDFKNKS